MYVLNVNSIACQVAIVAAGGYIFRSSTGAPGHEGDLQRQFFSAPARRVQIVSVYMALFVFDLDYKRPSNSSFQFRLYFKWHRRAGISR